VDGDTVELDVDLGMKIHHIIKVRLARINTPEISGVSKTSSEYAAGMKARERVVALLEGKDTIIHTAKDPQDRYGRYIAEIWPSDIAVKISSITDPDLTGYETVSDLLLREGLAAPYLEK
jgi:micrococcal nuclease